MVSYPQWDAREEVVRLDGPFQEGTTGFSKQTGRRPGWPFTLTRVEPTGGLFRTWRACLTTPPGTSRPVAGSVCIWPVT